MMDLLDIFRKDVGQVLVATWNEDVTREDLTISAPKNRKTIIRLIPFLAQGRRAPARYRGVG
jgi:hypothetical protein